MYVVCTFNNLTVGIFLSTLTIIHMMPQFEGENVNRKDVRNILSCFGDTKCLDYNFFLRSVNVICNETSYLSEEARLVQMLLRVQNLISGSIARPVRNSSVSVEVQFKIAIYYILSVNDKNQLLTTKIWKQMVST